MIVLLSCSDNCSGLRMDAEAEVLKLIGETSDIEELVSIHDDLKLPEVEDAKKDNVTFRRRVIVRHLSSDAVVGVDDEGLATFLHLLDILRAMREDPKGPLATEETGVSAATTSVVTTEIVETKGDDERMLKNANDAAVKDDTVLKNSNDVVKNSKDVSQKKTYPIVDNQVADSLRHFPWKKDLKLKGTIGDPKDTGPGKVTYLSLIRQIGKWVKKGYPEEEICDAVIEGISSDQSLRGMLEGKWDLSVAQLRRFLRVHFEEKDATEVYKDLSQLGQAVGQKTKEFVMKAIELRDKILFASLESGNRFQYPEELVRSTCWHTVVTGIRDDNVKNDVKAILERNPEDMELLECLTTSVKDEQERQKKMKEEQVKANLIKQKKSDQDAKKKEEAADKQPTKVNSVVAELKEIKLAVNEIKSVKDDVEMLKECVRNIGGANPNGFNFINNRNGNGRQVQFGCASCKQQNLRGCNHCFKCGDSTHKKPDCPN